MTCYVGFSIIIHSRFLFLVSIGEQVMSDVNGRIPSQIEIPSKVSIIQETNFSKVNEMQETVSNDNKSFGNKMDMRAFFRDVERGTHSFLSYWDGRAKSNQALFPYRMTPDEWWRRFIEYTTKNETR